ncbi:cilia- and flagella-associated protein 119 [Discoglossus pictus]
MSVEEEHERPGTGGLSMGGLRKPRVCLWRDLSMHDLEILERTESTEELRRALSRMLYLEGGLSQPRVSVLLDFYYYILRFCQDCGFSKEQTSSLVSIMRETHAACLDTPLDNAVRCYEYFKELLLCHSVHRPPFSVDLFSPQQVLLISDYFLKTYFRHFKLYKYVFTPQVLLDLSISYEGISQPEVKTEIEEVSRKPEVDTEVAAKEVEKEERSEPVTETDTPLRQYIEERLSEEVERLHTEVKEKLLRNEEQIQERLEEAGIVRGKTPLDNKSGKKKTPRAK